MSTPALSQGTKFFYPMEESLRRAALYSEERFNAIALTYIGGIANDVEREEAAYVVEAYISLATSLEIEEGKVANVILSEDAAAGNERQADFVQRCTEVTDEIRLVLAEWQPENRGH